MPIDYRRYPPDWSAIRERILARSGRCCEWCGVANYALSLVTNSRVVLTVAHMDHDVTNNADTNLAALCQRCHLRYDQAHHQRNAAETRRAKRIAAGQGSLL